MLREFSALLSLIKHRIGLLVLVTTSIGYFLASPVGGFDVTYLFLMLGTFLCCSGGAVLNHFIERDTDKLMLRTQGRALPQGRISPEQALSFGITLVLGGTAILLLKVSLLCAFLALLSAFLYVVVYTPLKRVTWLNTMIGAIPGALPPLGGWAAATGEAGLGGWVLFAILFIWQHPHFYSIAWIYREDYRRAGMKMLPSVDATGFLTFAFIIGFSVLLIPVSLLPTMLGLSGMLYASGAFLAGTIMLLCALKMSGSRTERNARLLLFASIIYLPVLLTLIAVDS